jgi:integrase
MAQGLHLLKARFVETVKEEGRYRDGGGLFLRVRKTGTDDIQRLWMFRYQRGERGRQVDKSISLGNARDVSMANAREMASGCREALARGEEPRAVVISAKPSAPTFGEVADRLVDDLAPGFKSEITTCNWRRTLGPMYCRPIRQKAVDEVTTDDVLDILRPIWQLKPETASKVRERIEKVLNVAKAKKLRTGDNPATWKGHLELMLPAQKGKRGHFRALPWRDIPAFLTRLRALDSVSALALEWTILTAVRTSDTIEAPRSEIDRGAKVWTIPHERLKSARDFRVPLVDRCIEIYDEMARFSGPDGWLFPGRDLSECLSNAAMSECLKTFKVDGTVHGMRSSFRDWAGDATEHAREVIEAALAHVVGDEVERAYRRSDALERRRSLMEDWAAFCDGKLFSPHEPS